MKHQRAEPKIDSNQQKAAPKTANNQTTLLAIGILGAGGAIAYALLRGKGQFQLPGTGANANDLAIQIGKEDEFISSFTTQIQVLQNEILRLQILLEEQNTALVGLRTDLGFLKDLLNNQGAILEDMANAIKDATEKTQALKSIAQQLQNEIALLQKDLQQQGELIFSLKISIGQMESLLLSNGNNIEEMENAVKGLDSSITELERIRQELMAEIGSDHPKLIEMEQYIIKADSYITSLRAALIKARQINEELLFEVASMQALIAALEQSNINMQERVAEAQAIITTLLQTIDELRMDLNKAQKQLEEAIRLNQEMQAKVDQIAIDLNAIIARNNEIWNDIATIGQGLRDLEIMILTTMTQIQEIENLLRENNDTTTAMLEAQILVLDSIIVGLTTLRNGLIEEIGVRMRDIASIDNEIGFLVQAIEELKVKIAQSKNTETQIIATIEALEKQISVLSSTHNGLIEEIGQMMGEIARLDDLIYALTQSIAIIIKQLEEEAQTGKAYDINWAAKKNGARAYALDEDRTTSQLIGVDGKAGRNGWYAYHAIDDYLATAWRGANRLHINFGKWNGVVINHISIIMAEPDFEDYIEILFQNKEDKHPGIRYIAPIIASQPDLKWFPNDKSVNLTNSPANSGWGEPIFNDPKPLIAYNMDIPEEITAWAMAIFPKKQGTIYGVVATRKSQTDDEFPIIVIPPVRKPCPKGRYCIDEKTGEIYGEPDIPHPMTDPGSGLAW